ncbi:hypothetical protein [Massilia sp. TSP1-1-2]|uniref:hypothetical protein n=1 Tax=unclassified Massilia TaxID=2609279 RepID=UPI003CECA731
MKRLNFIRARHAAAIVLALLAAVALSGCGGHHSDDDGDNPTPARDAFFATVSAIVSASSETTEANTIDVVVTTAPEDTEPELLR